MDYFIIDDNDQLVLVQDFQEGSVPARGLRRFTSSFAATTNKRTFANATFVRSDGHVFHCVVSNFVQVGSSTTRIEGFIQREEDRSGEEEVMEEIQRAL